MANNGDSSIWRRLAVAFGDGVAFGVGMKLTQRPPRPGAGEARGEPALAGRVDQIEQRLEALLTAPSVPAIDQRVLDAIVAAIDARVREHSAQVERRLADLDARLSAKLKNVNENDRAVAASMKSAIDAVRAEVFAEVGSLRKRLDEDRIGLAAQIAAAIQAAVRHKLDALAPGPIEPRRRTRRPRPA